MDSGVFPPSFFSFHGFQPIGSKTLCLGFSFPTSKVSPPFNARGENNFLIVLYIRNETFEPSAEARLWEAKRPAVVCPHTYTDDKYHYSGPPCYTLAKLAVYTPPVKLRSGVSSSECQRHERDEETEVLGKFKLLDNLQLNHFFKGISGLFYCIHARFILYV